MRWLINYVRKRFRISILEIHLIEYIFKWVLISFLATIISYCGVIIIYPGSAVKRFLQPRAFAGVVGVRVAGCIEPLEHRPSLTLAHLVVGVVNLQVLIETLEHAGQPREVVVPRTLLLKKYWMVWRTGLTLVWKQPLQY